MDPTLVEFAKYGAFALLSALVMYGLAKALVFMFKAYAEAKEAQITQGGKMADTVSANTTAFERLTVAVQALSETIKSRSP